MISIADQSIFFLDAPNQEQEKKKKQMRKQDRPIKYLREKKVRKKKKERESPEMCETNGEHKKTILWRTLPLIFLFSFVSLCAQTLRFSYTFSICMSACAAM